MAKKPKIVLYYPQQVDQARGVFTSYDIIPLELLHIGALPDAEGYEIVIIDANLYSKEEAFKRAIEACEGAIIFGTTAILGYMVYDGHAAALKVKEAHPNIKVIAGGWFPSVLPEQYLVTGIYDAVCMGQGELTFLDYIRAVENGEDAETVPGLCVWRDGRVVQTAHRAIVGFNKLAPRAAWHLIDIEPYRERQMRPGAREARNRMPSPPSKKGGNYFGISYFSSFGCPEPCSFCCSPEVTNQRWKAMTAEAMLDDLEDLKARWNFDMLRIQDANWGVSEKRNKAMCEGMLERDLRFDWTTTIEVHTILRSKKETLDLMRDAGLYVACVGAEAADPDMLLRVGKQIKPGDTPLAAKEMHDRGITTSLTYIIGYPNESAESMLATLDEARATVSACPSVSAHVYPFRPIPGNPMFRESLDIGYEPPKDLFEWGKMLEYHVLDTWKGNIPDDVKKVWKLYYQYASFMHGLVRPKRGVFERIAEWRMKSGNYSFPVELKAFYLMDRLFGWNSHKEDEKQSWIMSSEDEAVTMVQ